MPDCIMFSDGFKNRTHVPALDIESEAIAMKKTLLDQLLQYIERLDIDKLDESQLYVAIGFIKTLFGLHD